MSEKDRQTKLIGLRLEHRRLQQEEKHDEANEMISKLLGDQKGNYKKAMNKNDVILRYLNINVVMGSGVNMLSHMSYCICNVNCSFVLFYDCKYMDFNDHMDICDF